MKKVLPMVLVLLLVAVVSASAQSTQLFDFNGQTLVPAGVGGNLTMYAIVENAGQVDTPIPLDAANFEYTLVISGLQLSIDNGSQLYENGMIVIYEDNGTPADYSDPTSFTDGTPILLGNLYTLTRTMFTATLGTASGFVNWTGGSRIGDIAPADRFDWPLLTGISTRSTVTLPGYDENWDGKVEPESPIVPVDNSSFGALKKVFDQ